MRKIAMLLAAPMALLSVSVSAQTADSGIEILGLQAHPSDVDIGKAYAWPRINVDPFRGNVDQASLVLNPKTDLRPFEYHEAFAMRTRGGCHRYQFGPKDEFRTTFGLNRSMLAKPGFSGWSDVCVVRADGSAVIFPDGCTNIGPGMAIVKRRLVVDKPKRPRGRSATMTTSPGAPQVVQPVGVGVILFDGGGHTTSVQNGSGSLSGSSSKSRSGGSCTVCAPVTPPNPNPNHRP